MKTICSLLAVVLAAPALVHAQGSLTPSGAPAASMKTLSQVEPRTDVLKLPGGGNNLYIISSPGSYYLTTNVLGVLNKNGISIASGNVTLDLNGFNVQGVPAGSIGSGVQVGGTYMNITVANGTISGWPASGLDGYSAGLPRNVVADRLNVSRNGASGIFMQADSVVHDCLSISNAGAGIYSAGGQILRCQAHGNGLTGIQAMHCSVRDSRAQDNGTSGFLLTQGSATDCQSQGNGTTGFTIVSGSATGCQSLNNSTNGYFISNGSAENCYSANNLNGFFLNPATAVNCRSESNSFGFYCNASWSVVRGCTIANNNSYGILFGGAGAALDNDITGIGTYGIYVYAGSQIIGNRLINADIGYPIYIVYGGNGSRVDNNTLVVLPGGVGIDILGLTTNNIVTRNVVIGGGANNYLIPAGNDVGPIGTAATATSPWANISN
jgi:hypothetical protein